MIADFTDLRVWQEAHKLALDIYKVSARFPSSETYSLTSQIRRAAISITSNLAEGFGRFSKADQEHFYIMASGSLYELKSQLMLAKDLGYINTTDFDKIVEQSNLTHKLLNGLLKTHRSSK
jgi:four helix bundle protein